MRKITMEKLQEIFWEAKYRNLEWLEFLNLVYAKNSKYVNIRFEKTGYVGFYITNSYHDAIQNKKELGKDSKLYKITWG